MASAWDREKTYQLIQLIESHPVLWNVDLKQYRDRHIKAKAFETIARTLNVEPKEVNRKYHNLRCQLNHEIRKLKLKLSGPGSDVYVKSSWEFFDSLSFMKGFTDYTKNVECSVEDPIIYLYEEESPSNNITHKNKKSKLSVQTDEDKLLEEAINILRSPKDDCQIFGDFIASELREIRSDERRRRLKRTIQKVIIEIGEEEDHENGVS